MACRDVKESHCCVIVAILRIWRVRVWFDLEVSVKYRDFRECNLSSETGMQVENATDANRLRC